LKDVREIIGIKSYWDWNIFNLVRHNGQPWLAFDTQQNKTTWRRNKQ
jgi:hypothetical protein